MKNTSSCLVTRGQVVAVVKSKPSHNQFKSIVERSRVEKSRKRVWSCILHCRLKFIFKGKYESNIHYRMHECLRCDFADGII